MAAPAINLDPAHLAGEPVGSDNASSTPCKFRCRFCPGIKRAPRHITNLWSHIKLQHDEVSKEERLTAIKASAQDYAEWVMSRGYKYERDNASTWEKVVQTQASTFDWDVVLGWRLHQDRYHDGYIPR
jgi:hypothetical protein